MPEGHLALYVSDVLDTLDLSAILRVHAAADPRGAAGVGEDDGVDFVQQEGEPQTLRLRELVEQRRPSPPRDVGHVGRDVWDDDRGVPLVPERIAPRPEPWSGEAGVQRRSMASASVRAGGAAAPARACTCRHPDQLTC